jgi:hypothetical protein
VAWVADVSVQERGRKHPAAFKKSIIGSLIVVTALDIPSPSPAFGANPDADPGPLRHSTVPPRHGQPGLAAFLPPTLEDNTMPKTECKDTKNGFKAYLGGINPAWLVGGIALSIYLLEKHMLLLGVTVFVMLLIMITAVVFIKKYWVFFLSMIADLGDYMGGAIPISGDVMDMLIAIAQAMRYGPGGWAGLLELIPLADLLPVMFINALIAEYKINREK